MDDLYVCGLRNLLRLKRIKQNLAVQVPNVILGARVLIHRQTLDADVLQDVQQVFAERNRGIRAEYRHVSVTDMGALMRDEAEGQR
ncbi:hypothetical protein [Kangiella sp.]|uniref:hypothetical protein n=1 Tax=Kangiella sp. TaxID=1920245 RepID=UPI003A91AE32